jgi:hypothetical protein
MARHAHTAGTGNFDTQMTHEKVAGASCSGYDLTRQSRNRMAEG